MSGASGGIQWVEVAKNGAFVYNARYRYTLLHENL